MPQLRLGYPPSQDCGTPIGNGTGQEAGVSPLGKDLGKNLGLGYPPRCGQTDRRLWKHNLPSYHYSFRFHYPKFIEIKCIVNDFLFSSRFSIMLRLRKVLAGGKINHCELYLSSVIHQTCLLRITLCQLSIKNLCINIARLLNTYSYGTNLAYTNND